MASANVAGEPSLLAAGRFIEFAGTPARFVARYNGSAWTGMDAGLPPATNANGDPIRLTGQKTRLVVVNGTPWLGMSYGYGFTGLTLDNRFEIYRWNGNSWDLVINIPRNSFSIESVSNGSGDDLYVFSNFQNLAGVSGVSMIAKWNGTAFESVGNGIEPGNPQSIVSSVGSHDFGSGRRLVAVVDSFSTSGGQSVLGLLKLENGQWEPVPGGITARFVEGITSSTNPQWGGLYLAGSLLRNIGGTYLNVETIESRGLARLVGPTLPAVALSPQPQSFSAGQTLALSATATSSVTGVTVQWQRNGVNIVNGPGGASPGGGDVSGASGPLPSPTDGTPSTLTIANAQASDAGNFTAIFSNACGSITTSPATVTITGPVGCSIADLVGGDGNPPADGSVDGNDFVSFLNAFGAGDPLADLVGGDGNPPSDGSVDGNDFQAFLNAFAAGC